MILNSIAKRFAVLACALFIGGAGLWWALSPNKNAVEQKTDAPNVAEVPAEKGPKNGDGKTDVKNKEEFQTADNAARLEEERAKARLEQRVKGTWKVVFAEGEPSAVKLAGGGSLKKPAFYLSDKDHLTWDNGNRDDPARLVRFHLRFPNRQEIEISRDSALPQYAITREMGAPLLSSESVFGSYAFVGERLALTGSSVGHAIFRRVRSLDKTTRSYCNASTPLIHRLPRRRKQLKRRTCDRCKAAGASPKSQAPRTMTPKSFMTFCFKTRS